MSLDNQLSVFNASNNSYGYYPVDSCDLTGLENFTRLPFALRVLFERLLLLYHQGKAEISHLESILRGSNGHGNKATIPFLPARIILQDFSGVPVLNDFAALRAAVARRGGDPHGVQPVMPVDLVIDHSLQVDHYGSKDSYTKNIKNEFRNNRERYAFLKWCQSTLENVRIIPPASGIIHQVNLEYLTPLVNTTSKNESHPLAFMDSVLGTDSHTTMINGLGVSGWGIGGIEALGAMLGEPMEIVIPEVIGLHLTGMLREGVLPTDITLSIVHKLRQFGVVDKVVEVFGPGVEHLVVADRAMIANMAPESGATMVYFPVDEITIDYLRETGRSEESINLASTYCELQHLKKRTGDTDPLYPFVLEIDLGSIEPVIAGPKRPQDCIPLQKVKESFCKLLTNHRGYSVVQADEFGKNQPVGDLVHPQSTFGHGSVVIAAITSCTNTSNPTGMLAAGLLAKKAADKGLQVPAWVKTSFAPGSRVVTNYLKKAGLDKFLDALGFHLVGYGCTTCIGNSGPLASQIEEQIRERKLIVASILSGNRNFEGRVHGSVQANYLASPPLVIAYALAGRIDIDLNSEPLGSDSSATLVFLKDIWPTSTEIQELVREVVQPDIFISTYETILEGSDEWQSLTSPQGLLYPWEPESTYLKEPPFFKKVPTPSPHTIKAARIIVIAGDSTTTDHISPAGNIPVQSPAGQYLIAQNVRPSDFNAYGTRRGNDQVMVRGTFANVRFKNKMVPDQEGGFTIHYPDGRILSIFDACVQYNIEKIPLIILAGKEYGTGSSRDWAAKGVQMLGIKAVIAESFERIHRSNLAGMGLLPLQFLPGESTTTYSLDGSEIIDIPVDSQKLTPGCRIPIHVTRLSGETVIFPVILRLDTGTEINYYLKGGMLPKILESITSPGD